LLFGGKGKTLSFGFYNQVIPSRFLIFGLSAIWRKGKTLSFGFYNHVIPPRFLILPVCYLAGKQTKPRFYNHIIPSEGFRIPVFRIFLDPNL
jgi:hypothetical protein